MTSNVDEPTSSLGPIGFGAMHLSERNRPERPIAIETVHAALDAGVRLIDTADAYCQHAGETGHNEVLVAEALSSWGGEGSAVTVATKGGHVRDRYGRWDLDGRPEHLVAAAHASRKRLEVDTIQLYQFHRPDPSVEFSSSVGALAELQREGVVAHIGLSNVDVAQIERAQETVAVATIQNELSPLALQSLPTLRWCDAAGVPFLVWAPFGGRQGAEALRSDPTLQPFRDGAAAIDASVHQLILAWLISLSPVVVPIPGASRPNTIRESVDAGSISLDEGMVATLDAAVSASTDTNARRNLDDIRGRSC